LIVAFTDSPDRLREYAATTARALSHRGTDPGPRAAVSFDRSPAGPLLMGASFGA